jgi:hypothetical protein
LFIWKAVDVSRSDRQIQQGPRRPRLLALPFVVLCALVYLGSAVHFALVQHSTCLEHGESIHSGEEGVAAQPQWLEASFTDQRFTRSSQLERAGHGSEAHCTHTTLRRETLVPAALCLPTPEGRAVSAQGPGVEQLPSEPVARLRLAPKSSPPLS